MLSNVLLESGYKLDCPFPAVSLFLVGLYLLGTNCPFPWIAHSGIGGPLLGKVLGEVWTARLVLDKFFGVREFVQRSVLRKHWPVEAFEVAMSVVEIEFA